ncbi:50S ribosomal protein L25 [Candidatus Gracilibacteria bacterium]|nr:MAG: 50S ribosomal protein L25 [Candidatus Gracilibacteria bacterium]
MKDLVLNAQERKNDEKLSEIRASKMVPGVVYGKNKENIIIKIDNSDLIKTYRLAGESHIISLNVDGKSIEVLVHQFQKDPITGDFLHIDFYAITRGEKVTTKIALSFVGSSAAVRDGALLDEQIKEIEVKTLPRNLVDFFEVDLGRLEKVGDIIRISDLGIDTEKYDIINSLDDVVVLAFEPKKEVIEDSAPVAEENAETNAEEGK